VNVLDPMLVVGVAVAAGSGLRHGFVRRAPGWSGAALGTVAATALVRALFDGPVSVPAWVGVPVAGAVVLAGAVVGRAAGRRAGRSLPQPERGGVRVADRAAGGFAAAAGVVAALWLAGPALQAAGGRVAALADGSSLLRMIDEHTPGPPAPFAADEQPDPDGWDGLVARVEGVPDGPVPDLGAPPAALDARARAATLRVSRATCGAGVRDGTGFLAGPDLVVTNAHVVAGVPDPGASVRLVDDSGRVHRGRVVLYLPDDDLAVLRADTLDATPLPLATSVTSGATGWVYGHPDGRSLQVRPFRTGPETTVEVPAAGEQVRRRVLPVRAELAHGDSGSALVLTDGTVAGVAFAVSADEPTVALAVAVPAVRAAVARAEAAGPDAAEADTGPCGAAG
jgi:hypothetical protein